MAGMDLGRPLCGGTAGAAPGSLVHAFNQWVETVSDLLPTCSSKACKDRRIPAATAVKRRPGGPTQTPRPKLLAAELSEEGCFYAV